MSAVTSRLTSASGHALCPSWKFRGKRLNTTVVVSLFLSDFRRTFSSSSSSFLLSDSSTNHHQIIKKKKQPLSHPHVSTYQELADQYFQESDGPVPTRFVDVGGTLHRRPMVGWCMEGASNINRTWDTCNKSKKISSFRQLPCPPFWDFFHMYWKASLLIVFLHASTDEVSHVLGFVAHVNLAIPKEREFCPQSQARSFSVTFHFVGSWMILARSGRCNLCLWPRPVDFGSQCKAWEFNLFWMAGGWWQQGKRK